MFSKQSLILIIFILLTVLIVSETTRANSDTLYIEATAEQLAAEDLNLQNNHRYFDGPIDDAYDPDFDDSNWEIGEQMSLSIQNVSDSWVGQRWYRVYIDVDPSLRNQKVALRLNLFGAAEIWLNGELVSKIGNPTNDSESFEYADMVNWMPVHLSEDQHQVFAFKFVNPRVDRLSRPFFTVPFNPSLSELDRSRNEDLQQFTFWSSIRWFFVGFCLVFTVTHLLLFLFNRKNLFNLWFSISCLLFGFIALVVLDFFTFVNPETRLFLQRMMQSALMLVFVFMTLFLYSALSIKLSRISFGIIGLSIVLAVVHLFRFTPGFLLIFILGAMIIYTSIKAFRSQQEGSIILGSGTIIFVLSVIAVLLLEHFGYQPDESTFSFIQLPFLGFGIALVAMSIFQSRYQFLLNQQLQNRLQEVKQLSQKNLEQERNLHQSELEKVRLETENERKTAELEKARKMQLSLLPAGLPSSNMYDIQAKMLTANEVGGDYYDYIELDNDHMIWTLGDATGHGTDAGLIVAMTKPLFQTLAPEYPSEQSLKRMSTELKRAGLKKHFMCLGLLEIKGPEISWCSAGIPPAIILRNGSLNIELLESKGMPLGTVTDFDYQKYQTTLENGDALILLSDGWMEQMNNNREQMGMERIKTCLLESRWQSANEVVQSLIHCLNQWKQEMEQQDDVTVVVLMKRETNS